MRIRNQIFSTLRDRWLDSPNEDGSRRTSVQLAERLGTRRQLVSNYANGTGGSSPSWDTLTRLAAMQGLEIRMTNGMIVATRVKIAPDGGLAVLAEDLVFQVSPDERKLL